MSNHAGSLTRNEILSQPEVWGRALRRLDESGWAQFPDTCPRGPGLLIGAGTSLYLARILAHVGRAVSGEALFAVPPSDILVAGEDYTAGKKPWSMGISRSGTTTETVRALGLLRDWFSEDTYALTCHSEAEMAKHATATLAVDEAAEASVVMTRSFTTMLLAMSRWIFRLHSKKELLAAQEKLEEVGGGLMDRLAADAAEAVKRFTPGHIVTFGQGAYYGLACEVALKVKEMAILPSEPFHTLEYRHGPKSIAGEETLIIALMSDRGRELEAAVLKEMRALGARVWAIAESAQGLTEDHADLVTELGTGLPEFARLPLVLPALHLYGLELALSRGQDPDNPKNLTQVVTL